MYIKTKPLDAEKPYHHGDMHNACVTAALELVRTAGLTGLTLRGVAERTGVSRSAPYRHFNSKRDLLAACAERGFRQLTKALQAASDAAGADTISKLRAGVAAYGAFGADNSDLYKLMFSSDFIAEEYPALSDAGEAAFGVLVGVLEQAQAAGLVKPDNTQQQAVAIWSAMHGVVNLYIDSKPSRVLDTTALQDNMRQVMTVMLNGVGV